MRVVCAVEGEAYLRHLAAMLHSLLVHHPEGEVRIDCMHCGDTSPRSRARLVEMVSRLGSELVLHDVPDERVAGLPVKGFTRKATWYRIHLDELLPDVDRVLYLDVDLLVLDSLSELWRTGLGDHLIGAVDNVPEPHYRSYVERPEMGGDRYFNAGVILIDLAAWRREKIGPTLRSFAVTHAQRYMWRDQDALNEVLHARRLPLAPRWNSMNALMWFSWSGEYFDADELAEARARPAIRHFEGPEANKPWHLLADPEMHRLYATHRGYTPWPRGRRSGTTPRNLIRWVGRGFA